MTLAVTSGFAGQSVEAEMHVIRLLRPSREATDEQLLAELAAGRQEALGALHSRYAGLLFNLAAQSLDRPAAEEVVQDVFLAVWRKADTFRPERGAFRSWVLQITHFRIINELRHRGRRPRLDPNADDADLAELPAGEPAPDEQAWRAYQAEAVQSALGELPSPQRQAVRLAFFDGLSHQQVASELNVPLGTVKTRIRTGLSSMRGKLAAVVAAAALVSAAALLGLGAQSRDQALQRDERALALVTSSSSQTFRATAASGAPEATHGVYRGQSGAPIAVMTFSSFAPAPAGQTYQAWAYHDGGWTSLGTFQPGPDGAARLIAEGPNLASLPTAIQVTQEPAGGSPNPTGPAVIAWPTP
jgi:RNA polymerase sigma-70 factor (ECF subfamily)